MKGKTHGKDIMLLCKGWYNKEKYKTTKDALIAYYNKNYWYPNDKVKILEFRFINNVLLKPAIQELLTENFIHMFISYLFDIDGFDIWKFDDMKIKELPYDEELYYRLTGFLSRLRAKDKDLNINIDDSAYWKKDEEGNIIFDHHYFLAEPIIE